MCIIDPAWEDANTPDYPAFRRIDDIHGVGAATKINGKIRYFRKKYHMITEEMLLAVGTGKMTVTEVMNKVLPLREASYEDAIKDMHAAAKENE